MEKEIVNANDFINYSMDGLNDMLDNSPPKFTWSEVMVLMKTFAKYHTELALKAAADKVSMTEASYHNDDGSANLIIDKQSILNAYPKDLIK